VGRRIEYQKRLDTLMAQYHNIKEDTDVTEDILDSIEEMLESRMRPWL
jgi:hypothetical protein